MPSIEDRPYPFLKFKQGDIQGISSVSGSITKGEFKNAEIVFKDGGGIKFNGRKFVLKPGAQVTIDGDTIRFRNDASFILDNKEFKAEGGEVKVDAKKGQDPKFSLGKDSSIKAGSQSLLSKDGASLVYSKDGFLLENGAVNFKTEEGVDVRVSRISAAPDSRPLFTDDGVRLPKGSRADTIGTDGKTISSSFVPLKDQVWLADSKANYDKISGDKKVYFKSPDDIRFDRGVTALFS